MNKADLMATVAGLALLAAAQKAHATPLVIASIGVFGPNGEVISYKKEGDSIHLRVCIRNTLKTEIENSSGCRLADGTSEVVLSERAFRGLVNTELAKIDDNVLSPQQKTLLERDLTHLPNLDDERRLLADLRKQLQRLVDFGNSPEGRGEADPNEAKLLQNRIDCLKNSAAGYGELIDAKDQVASIVDGLISDMNGKQVRRILKHTQDGRGIAYNLLRTLASVDACDPARVARAPSGYKCRAGSVVWKIESDTYAGKRVYRDMKSGLKVTEPLDGTSDQNNSGRRCANGYRLPSGYPSGFNGVGVFPHQDSDFVVLDGDGIRQVVPGMKDHWFWSSSFYPYNAYYGYDFYGNTGVVHDYDRNDYYEVVLCVGDR